MAILSRCQFVQFGMVVFLHDNGTVLGGWVPRTCTWLITMVIVSPLSRVGLVINDLIRWLLNGGDPNHLTGMILQVFHMNFGGQESAVSQMILNWRRPHHLMFSANGDLNLKIEHEENRCVYIYIYLIYYMIIYIHILFCPISKSRSNR